MGGQAHVWDDVQPLGTLRMAVLYNYKKCPEHTYLSHTVKENHRRLYVACLGSWVHKSSKLRIFRF